MNKFKTMTDDYLKKNYIPDVYQRSIHAIDYQKLKDAGIRFLSFDIDDTIAGLEDSKPQKAEITLFENLKNMGFQVMLLTNARDSRADRFSKALGVGYIARAHKPRTDHFQELQDICGLDKSQMAHIGNSQMDDIAGGNAFGITTCLIRRVGKLTGVSSKIANVLNKTEGQELRDELKKRGLWRKHHKDAKDDQFYQLGETPAYQK